MGEHDPLGPPGRARGVEEEGQVVARPVDQDVEGRRRFDLAGDVACVNRLDGAQTEERLAGRAVAPGRVDHRSEDGRHQRDLRPRVFEQIADLTLPELGHDRQDDGAQLPHRLEGAEDLGAVRHHDNHPVACSNAARSEHGGQLARQQFLLLVGSGLAPEAHRVIDAETGETVDGELCCVHSRRPSRPINA